MGEGGGFPRVRAVVNLVSPELPVACPVTTLALARDQGKEVARLRAYK